MLGVGVSQGTPQVLAILDKDIYTDGQTDMIATMIRLHKWPAVVLLLSLLINALLQWRMECDLVLGMFPHPEPSLSLSLPDVVG